MSSWAEPAIARLRAGQSASIRPRGHSMRPKVISGARVDLEPIPAADALAVGDIVLVKVTGRVYLHLVSAIQGERVQIANNRGHVNGWTSRASVYGRAVRIQNP